MGIDRVGEAVLSKVRAEAEAIVKDAEEKARGARDKAAKEHEAKLLAEKNRMLEEARGEASRIMAQAALKARQEILAAKTGTVNEIISQVKKVLAASSGDESASLRLIKEGIQALNADKVRVYVSPRQVSGLQKLIKADR